MNPLSEIEAEHDRRSLQALHRAIKRSTVPPWKRRLKVGLAVAFLAVMLVVTVSAVRAVRGGSAAAKCPASGVVTSHGWLNRRVWWFTVTNRQRHCTFSIFTGLNGYLGCAVGTNYPMCTGSGGGGGRSW